eukprot:10292996-Ditylum_brightwellii.AAC.1
MVSIDTNPRLLCCVANHCDSMSKEGNVIGRQEIVLKFVPQDKVYELKQVSPFDIERMSIPMPRIEWIRSDDNDNDNDDQNDEIFKILYKESSSSN